MEILLALFVYGLISHLTSYVLIVVTEGKLTDNQAMIQGLFWPLILVLFLGYVVFYFGEALWLKLKKKV